MPQSLTYEQVWTPYSIRAIQILASEDSHIKISSSKPKGTNNYAVSNDGQVIRQDGKPVGVVKDTKSTNKSALSWYSLIVALIVVITVGIVLMLALAGWRWYRRNNKAKRFYTGDNEHQSHDTICERRQRRKLRLQQRKRGRSELSPTRDGNKELRKKRSRSPESLVMRENGTAQGSVTTLSTSNAYRKGSSYLKPPHTSTDASFCRFGSHNEVRQVGQSIEPSVSRRSMISVRTANTFTSFSTLTAHPVSPCVSESDDGASRLSRAMLESPVVGAILTEMFELKGSEDEGQKRSSTKNGANRRKSFDWNRCAFEDVEEQAMWLPPSSPAPSEPIMNGTLHQRSASESAMNRHVASVVAELHDSPKDSSNEHHCAQPLHNGAQSLPSSPSCTMRMKDPLLSPPQRDSDNDSFQSIEECATYPPRVKKDGPADSECRCQQGQTGIAPPKALMRPTTSLHYATERESVLERGRPTQRSAFFASVSASKPDLYILTKGSNRSTESLRLAGALAIRSGSVDSLRSASAYELAPSPAPSTEQSSPFENSTRVSSSTRGSLRSIHDGRVPTFSTTRSKGGKLIKHPRNRAKSANPSTTRNIPRQSLDYVRPRNSDGPVTTTLRRSVTSNVVPIIPRSTLAFT